MGFPTLSEVVGGTQLMQPVPDDLNWKDYFLDLWYVTAKLSERSMDSYEGSKLWRGFSKGWDVSIGLATDAPKIILYTATATALLHEILS